MSSCWETEVYFLTFVISAGAEGGKQSGSCPWLLDEKPPSTYRLEDWVGQKPG